MQLPSAGSPGVETAIVAGLLTVAKAFDHFKGKRRDARHAATQHRIEGELRDLRAHVIGPDSQGGLRADLAYLERRVTGIEDRERRADRGRDD